MIIAVTGADGWVGARIVGLLREQGIGVRRLVRRARDPEDRVFDLADTMTDWSEHLRGCEGIIHCAARVHIPEAADAVDALVWEKINTRGTRRLIDAAVAARVTRFVFVSTIAVYDWSQPGPWDEASPVRPTSEYARSKLAAERALRESSLDWRICRLATVFGSGDRANFARLARALRCSTFILPGDGCARKSVIPVDMAAKVIAQAVINGSWSKTVCNVALAENPTLREICRGFEQLCGFRPPRRLPLNILKPIALIGTLCHRVGIAAPFTQSVLTKLITDTAVDTRRLQKLSAASACGNTFRDELKQYASYYRNC